MLCIVLTAYIGDMWGSETSSGSSSLSSSQGAAAATYCVLLIIMLYNSFTESIGTNPKKIVFVENDGIGNQQCNAHMHVL